MPNAEKDARELAEATVYDTLMDDRGEAEDADAFDLARRIVADLIESGVCVIPPGERASDFWYRLGHVGDGLPTHLPMGVTRHGQGPTEPDPAHHYECWCGDVDCPLTLALQHAWLAGRRVESGEYDREMPEDGDQFTRVSVHTKHPERYLLINRADGTRWEIRDGSWKRATED